MMNAEPTICRKLRCTVAHAIQSRRWAQLLDDVNFASLEQFSTRIPVVDRDDLFCGDFSALIRGNDLSHVEVVRMSSGTTGSHRAIGMLDRGSLAREATRLYESLARLFDVGRRVLLLNTLGDGVAVPLPADAGLCLSTGGRVDLGNYALARLASQFREVLVVGEPAGVVAQLQAAQSQLSGHRVRVVVGGETLDEHTREKMCTLLELDPDRNTDAVPLSSLGMAEIGLHILWETPSTVALRRQLQRSPDLVRALCADALRGTPSVMTYDPRHFHIEIVEGELVVTRLDPDHLQPMIRYNSHDRCGWIDRSVAADLLATSDPHHAARLSDRMLWIGATRGQCHVA